MLSRKLKNKNKNMISIYDKNGNYLKGLTISATDSGTGSSAKTDCLAASKPKLSEARRELPLIIPHTVPATRLLDKKTIDKKTINERTIERR